MTSYQIEEEQSSNRKIAFFITFGLYSLMFFLFWYIVIWTAEENKKVEEAGGGGFVVNFGTDKKGSGNVFTKNHASALKNEIDSKPAEVAELKKVIKKLAVPEVAKVKSVKPRPVKETPVITSKVKSPVVVKETPPAKVTSKPSPKPLETSPSPAPKVVEQPKVNTDGLFPSKKGKTNSNGTTGSNPNAGGGADGNTGGKGNQGQPDGNAVKGGTYEKKPPGDGTGGGSGKGGGPGGDGSGGNKPSLSLTGWTWTSRPNVSDDSDETGIIKFRIKVDADGDVVDVTQIESTLSPAVAQQYKRAVQRTKFKPTSDGDKPDISTGTVSFRLSPR
jgi:outer membrane biosynthesis protein TonB